MANLSITLSPHPEERRKARFEGWSSIFRRLPAHPSKRRFAAPQDEGAERIVSLGAQP